MDPQRRKLLMLSLSALTLVHMVQGCALLDTSTEFDNAVEALEDELRRVADGHSEEQAFVAAADAIAASARALFREHERFLVRFDRDLRDAGVGEDALMARIDRYDTEYRRHRAELLRQQDVIRGELSADEWAQVGAVLNQTAGQLQIRTLGGA